MQVSTIMIGSITFDTISSKSMKAREYNSRTGCAVEATLDVIGGRWKAVIVFYLLHHKMRFGELKKRLPNVTQRMLTLQLRELEEDGVLTRTVYAEVPPRVEYELTEFGRSLKPVLIMMRDWGETYKALLEKQDVA